MIITLTGPSCAGKTTLEEMLVARGFVRAISTTTRPKRAGEVNGESYYFVEQDAFRVMAAAGSFVETVEFGGNCYGLSVAEVVRLIDLGKPIVVVCEPTGQKQIAAWCAANNVEILPVFVDNPDQVIAERFLGRLANEIIEDRNGKQNSIIATYARRMKEMMTTEQAWREEARPALFSRSPIYKFLVSEFDEGNGETVANFIADHVRETLGETA